MVIYDPCIEQHSVFVWRRHISLVKSSIFVICLRFLFDDMYGVLTQAAK